MSYNISGLPDHLRSYGLPIGNVSISSSSFFDACQSGDMQIIGKILQTVGKTVLNQREGENKETPLLILCKNEHRAAALQLINAGADVTAAAKDGTTVLHLAAEFGWIELIEPIFSRCSAFDSSDLLTARGTSKQLTPILLALLHSNVQFAHLLTSKGVLLRSVENSLKSEKNLRTGDIGIILSNLEDVKKLKKIDRKLSEKIHDDRLEEAMQKAIALSNQEVIDKNDTEYNELMVHLQQLDIQDFQIQLDETQLGFKIQQAINEQNLYPLAPPAEKTSLEEKNHHLTLHQIHVSKKLIESNGEIIEEYHPPIVEGESALEDDFSSDDSQDEGVYDENAALQAAIQESLHEV